MDWIYGDNKMRVNNNFLCVGGHVPEAHGGEAGAGEVEGGDVGLEVSDAPGVLVVVLTGQHVHPASANKQW